MKPPKMIILIFVGMSILFDGALGQQLFMEKYRDAIQEYIMTGHEKGWQHRCDVLSANSFYDEDVPHISMTLDRIQTLNIKTAFENTHCLLVNYDVSSKDSLSTLLKFARIAINHVRLALVMKMQTHIALEALGMAKNISNLPFVIAVKLENGMEAFLCPVVGELKPHLGYEMCKPSYLHYKHKTLRVGLMGIPPEFVTTSAGTIEGVNIRMVKMISEKLEFTPKIHPQASFRAAVVQVTFAL